MNSSFKKALFTLLPFLALLGLIVGLAWWSHLEIARLTQRLVSAEDKISTTDTKLSQFAGKLNQVEERLNSLAIENTAVRAELVRLQRGSYDHEKMLASIFNVQKSGDSIFASPKQDGKSISISVSK